MENLTALLSGRLSSVVCKRPPRPAREVAREVVIAASEDFDTRTALDILVRDLGEVAEWAASQVVPREVFPSPSTLQGEDGPPSAQGQPCSPYTASSIHSNASDDHNALRQALTTRQALVFASLPARIAPLSFDALTHFTHEHGLAHYTNPHTFRGRVPVEDIPRECFFVTADGWAWDIRELVDELMRRGEGADGTLRNPVTGAQFEKVDVRRLVAHPFGRGLSVAGLDEEERTEPEREEEIGFGESGGIEVRAAHGEVREDAPAQDLSRGEDDDEAEAGPWVEEMAEEAWPAPEVVPEELMERSSGHPFPDPAEPVVAAVVAHATRAPETVRIPETIHELQAVPSVHAVGPRSTLVKEREEPAPEEFSMLSSELERRPTSSGDRDEEYNTLFRNSDDDALAPPPSVSRPVPTPLSWKSAAERPSSPLHRTFSTKTGDSGASDGEWYLKTRDPP
ncbi:hypothetical protein B0H67DRAFT_594399 [Lasiosphaeris hirsuta]|uniref:Uncharacterized protein n=1 Tax=Lasiosphaeris hirsuta TaxID=260670 RepID=A0AA39ZXZ1_9PEZI|nr:hypothetical protein B0H67DRAFT_594399 [Lasiosphaeris hirsuta]